VAGRGDVTMFTEFYQVRAEVLIQKLQETGKMTDLQKTEHYDLCDIYNANETVHFSACNLAKSSLSEEIFAMVV
jgi:hypothetical protein